jgi:AbrB family looped-hinge helix DNA binding protein
MPSEPKTTTTLSTKGQLILPAAIRRRHRWTAGTKLMIEETPEGILLKTAPSFETRQPAEIFGCLSYKGPAKTVEDMKTAVGAEVRRRRARDRY